MDTPENLNENKLFRIQQPVNANIAHRIVNLFKTLPDSTILTLNTLLQVRDNVIKVHIRTLSEVSFTEIAIAEIDLNKKLTSQTH